MTPQVVDRDEEPPLEKGEHEIYGYASLQLAFVLEKS